MIGSKRHRSPRIAGLAMLCSAALVAGTIGTGLAAAGTARVAPRLNSIDFDFDKGNALPDVLYGRVGEAIKKYVSPKGTDATLVFRIAALASVAHFDAIAPYRPTAVGIYSNLGRRPAEESAGNRNRNIAILYASYRVYNSLIPEGAADWRKIMTDVGLNPDDDQENATTAIGIGNLAGKSVNAARLHDGMNQLGDAGGRKYNLQPYADYLGFKPANTAYEIRDPSLWQPAVVTKGNGIFQVQQFVTPQLMVTKPFTYDDPKKFLIPPPHNSDYEGNRAGYKRQTDEVLAASAGLTDATKMRAEFFDDKFRGIGYSSAVVALNRGIGIDKFIDHVTAADIGVFDASISVWYDKWKYQAVRPFTTVRVLYGGQKVTAWGGPGKGTVEDLPAKDWRPYLGTPDHPEYPSGSTAACAATAQAGRRAFGTDDITLSYTFAKGSSSVEPGLTPTAATTLSWTTWSDWLRDCGLSRLNGGVHFKAAIEASKKLGPQFGDRSYDLVQAHVAGKRGSGG
ncbi:DUF6851 domain-containing protein [Actinomadura alba]|uniref:Vanadium-dependent haloperoxidase n=1 Tax=Actinomadura alba TaxID=406431 RepID=A0ABR7LH05_9ACTN|nr:hypothetical protein [Actinomadura alba]MBC6464122.1 hypothetical protein [Actinomadura alba]